MPTMSQKLIHSATIFGEDESQCSADLLEKYGRWLVSIPRDDALVLQQTFEYHQFKATFDRLCQAHQRVIRQNRNLNSNHETRPTSYSFLQQLLIDDVVVRIFEFLECSVLCRVSSTCHRLRDLAQKSAQQRSSALSQSRTLSTPMQMLRAQEQIDGVMAEIPPFVRVPALGLKLRVLVTNAGDDEYNGIYFCTQVNGNGYVFTKPRLHNNYHAHRSSNTGEGVGRADQTTTASINRTQLSSKNSMRQHRILRCVIAKRFSEQTILWYMSKELEKKGGYSDLISNEHDDEELEEEFSFYATLMVSGWAPPGISQYPSQTSILSRHGDAGWQSLSNLNPPVVELLE
mmetsp:Transcript_6289/g.9217  ORF Transcript_6289/g.9217 Transcript_6289/m.9217 type:complete len:345 (+) Transcript_6289:96-1130(+)